jgi:predicted RNA-binding Zn ribbon-like protein
VKTDYLSNEIDFDFDAGELCLDFANTAEMHASQHPDELLHEYDDLIDWGQAAGLLPPGRVQELRQLAEEHPNEASAVYTSAIRLREAIYNIFSLLSTEQQINSQDLQILNTTVGQALPHLHLVANPKGFHWDWMDDPQALDQIIWPVARSAAELLTSEVLDRVRQCADEQGCGYLFIDMSRNRSRRWCSMDSCGNRAKASRHYQRQRDSKTPS